MSRLFHELEFHLHRSADRAIIRGFILAHVSTDLADIVGGLAVGEHIVHGLFIELGMPAFHVARLSKGLLNGLHAVFHGIFDRFWVLFHIGLDLVFDIFR